MNALFRISALLCIAYGLAACSSPEPGPDKSVSGAVLGAAWGAGSGAIIGNQVGHTGEGAGIGAGFGAVGGALSGYGYDQTEEVHHRMEEQLASLKLQNLANTQELRNLQDKVDESVLGSYAGGIYQVYFDDDASSLRAGAIANLEKIAESLRMSPNADKIIVAGHADDAGTPEYNQRLSEARARTVAAYLAARGLSVDQITVQSHGSTRPLASNATPEGRQLNRRVEISIGK